jgi:hypothetical protein
MVAGRNVELVAVLSGPTSQVGGVDALLGEAGLGPVLEEYDRGPEKKADQPRQEHEAAFEKAHEAISASDLRARTQRVGPDLYRLSLVGWTGGFSDIVKIAAYPVSDQQNPVELPLAKVRGQALSLGDFPSYKLTGFVEFAVWTRFSDEAAIFALSLPEEGFPKTVAASIAKRHIKDENGLVSYLRMVLADDSFLAGFAAAPPSQGAPSDESSGQPAAKASLGVAEGLLELMAKAFSRKPDRLKEALSMIHLFEAEGIDPALLDLRVVFIQALKEP